MGAGGGRRVIAGALVAVLCAACTALTERRGKPLYAVPAQPLARSQVAVIGGYVGEVDGRDVSEETGPFEVLPGCHVVRTLAQWGAQEADGELIAETGRVPFALPMKAGHYYELKVLTSGPSAPSGTYTIEAIETDPQGRSGRIFSPSHDEDALEECANQPQAD